jgi:FkbM family methyltransferase
MKINPSVRSVFPVVVWLAFGALVYTPITRFMPPLVNLALNPKVAPVCSTVQAIYGLRTHIAATDAAPGIRRRSKLLKTDPSGYHQWATPLGSYWIPELTDDALWILLGQQQRDIYDEGRAAVKPGDVVLDCGAHIGVFTRTALKRGASMVVAIEPAPENLECLRRNFAEEIKSGRVVVYPKGVWDKDDFLPMHVNRNSAGDSFVLELDPGQPVIKLPLTTIDQIASELRLSRVDFIKMDIKGAEVPALQGAAHTLASYQPRMSVASEHLETDPKTIPMTVLRANPRYRVDCGSCVVDNGTTRPEVLHFY